MLYLFSEVFPKILYSVRKLLELQNSYIKYVVCPTCHRQYKQSDCVLRGPSGETSLKGENWTKIQVCTIMYNL